MIVDGGRAGAYRHLKPRLEAMSRAEEPLALFVLSHIDADHIGGALKMIEDDPPPHAPARVWYNGFDQLTRFQPLGEKQGDRYTKALRERKWPWNDGFEDGIVSVETAPGRFEVEGLTVTLLSPDLEHLAELRERWEDWREQQAALAAQKALETEDRGTHVVPLGRSPMPAVLDVEQLAAPGPTDREPPNGSSIAFIAEWKGHRILLAADAHPNVLERELRPLAAKEGGRYRLDLVKVAHHGSRKNTTSDLIRLLDCGSFAISTNGNLHGHPDPEAISRLLLHAPERKKCLYFNYDTDRTRPWDNRALKERYHYECVFATDTPGLLEIDIESLRSGPCNGENEQTLSS
jgi:beta-lactamase superfamily II metal-dependent hydrolase